jgi:hypothetical protein
MLLAPSNTRKTRMDVRLVLFLIASYLIIVFVLPIALSATVGYRALSTGPSCPHCHGQTLLLQRRGLAVLHMRLLRLQRRWCLDCRWEGVARQASREVATSPAAVRATHTLDVRSLTFDGRAWRVMLQYWNQTGLFYGRLVFIAPTGKLLLDAKEAFTGESQNEVLGQALAMPDGMLTNRLRRLVSDY